MDCGGSHNNYNLVISLATREWSVTVAITSNSIILQKTAASLLWSFPEIKFDLLEIK